MDRFTQKTLKNLIVTFALLYILHCIYVYMYPSIFVLYLSPGPGMSYDLRIFSHTFPVAMPAMAIRGYKVCPKTHVITDHAAFFMHNSGNNQETIMI